jgi:hypothetical protein
VKEEVVMTVRDRILLVALGTLASCGPAPDDEFRTTTAAALVDSTVAEVVDPWATGSNSPIIGDGVVFDELHANGAINGSDVRIRDAQVLDRPNSQAQPTKIPVVLQVTGDSLVALSLADPERRFEGQQLKGMTVTLQHGPTGALYQLVVADVHEGCPAPPPDLPAPPCANLRFWAEPREPVVFYEFRVRTLSPPAGSRDPADPDGTGPTTAICRGGALTSDPDWSGVEYSALVFSGDRYDRVRKTVSSTPPGEAWFNLACAGTTMAKMHLLRHTAAGSFNRQGLDRSTTLDERQAMLKMLTADYCGDGRSFTEDGHHLEYADAGGWYTNPWGPFNGRGTSFEAIWGPDGAVCLDTPRLVIKDEIVCDPLKRELPLNRPPPCADLKKLAKLGWKALGHVASANPPGRRD